MENLNYILLFISLPVYVIRVCLLNKMWFLIIRFNSKFLGKSSEVVLVILFLITIKRPHVFNEVLTDF